MVSNVPDPLSSSRAQLALGERIAAAEAEGARLRTPRCSPELPCRRGLGSPRLGTPFSPGWTGPEEKHRQGSMGASRLGAETPRRGRKLA